MIGAVAAALAGLPLVVAGMGLAVGRPDVIPDGDLAIDEIALRRSEHLAQLVGNYSRYGWSHPGPSWFYAVDTVYAPLGSHTYGFYVGVLLLHALFGVLLVALLWRVRGALAAGITAVLVLLFLVVISAGAWRTVWPPFAPILPMALLFPLAAWGAVRSTPAFVGALIAGSYALQAHVGTTLTVLAVWVVMALLRVAWYRADRRSGRAATARDGAPRPLGLLTPVGALMLLLMWLPVAVDQVAGQHNLSQLATFFLSPQGQHGWRESLSALATLLASFTSGYVPPLQQSAWLPAPPSTWVILGVYVAAIAALFTAATALRDRFAQALALMLGVAFPVVVLSVRHATGPIYPYFLLWTTVMPMLVAVGWGALLAGQAERIQSRSGVLRAIGIGVAALLLVPAAAQSVRLTTDFQRLPSPVNDNFDPYTRQAWQLTAAALAQSRPATILVAFPDDDRWPMAAGIALQLAKAGWTIQVEPGWTYMFGAGTAPNGTASRELIVVDAQRAAPAVPAGARLVGRTPDAELYLASLYPGQSP